MSRPGSDSLASTGFRAWEVFSRATNGGLPAGPKALCPLPCLSETGGLRLFNLCALRLVATHPFLKTAPAPCSCGRAASKAQVSAGLERWDACTLHTPQTYRARPEPAPVRLPAKGECQSGSSGLGEPFGSPHSLDRQGPSMSLCSAAVNEVLCVAGNNSSRLTSKSCLY